MRSQPQLLPAPRRHRPGGLSRVSAGAPRTRVEGVRVQHPMGLMAAVVATVSLELRGLCCASREVPLLQRSSSSSQLGLLLDSTVPTPQSNQTWV